MVVLGGADAINFLTQYQQGGGTLPLIGGSITADQTVLGTKGQQRKAVVGMPSAGPTADTWDDPKWKEFVAAYSKAFPDGFPVPSLFADAYYMNTKAALLALEQVNGDLSDGGVKFREALSKLTFDTPTGPVKLDHNRNAIADIFVTEVTEGAERRPAQQGRVDRQGRERDARRTRGRVPEDRRRQPRQPGLQVSRDGTIGSSSSLPLQGRVPPEGRRGGRIATSRTPPPSRHALRRATSPCEGEEGRSIMTARRPPISATRAPMRSSCGRRPARSAR